MADIINLRRARKLKAREASEKNASVSRATFGRTKVERVTAQSERERADRHIEGHKLPSDREDGET
jgi:hypothetical protein